MPRVTNHICQGRAAEPMRCCQCPSPIVRGERYYQWSIKRQRGGVTYRQHESHGAPRPSQLTESKMSGVYAAIESAEEAIAAAGSPEDVAEALRAAASDVEGVRDEYQESLDNMPEGLQQGDTGQQIEERVSNLEDFAQTLNDAADECESMETEEADEADEPEAQGDETPEQQAEREQAKESAEQESADNLLQAAQDRANEALGELNE